LKIWITPLASVAMEEKLALLKIALCRAPILTSDSSDWKSLSRSEALAVGSARPVSASEMEIVCPDSGARAGLMEL
jgi:hypothetical protein